MPRPLPRLVVDAALPLLLLFLGSWGVWAILLDQQPAMSDSVLQESVDLYRALGTGSPSLGELWSRPTYRPFLTFLPASLLFLLTGPSLALLRITVLLQYLAAVFVAHDIGRVLASRRAGLLAAVMLGTFPAVFGWGRMAYVDFGMSLLLLLGVRVLATCDLARWSCGARLGLTTGLGLLTKVAFPIFAVGPLLWCLALRIRRLRHLATLAVALVTTAVVAGWWYLHNWSAVSANVLMSAGSQAHSSEQTGVLQQVLEALPDMGDKLASYTVDVDGAVWLLALALVGSIAAWRLRTLRGDALLLLSMATWPGLVLILLFHQSRRYVLPVYLVAAVLAGTSLQTVLERLGGRRLARLAAGLLALVLLADFVALNLGLPLHTRPASAFHAAGPRVDGLGLLSPDRRPLNTFTAVTAAVRKRFDGCLLVHSAAEVEERQTYLEELLRLRGAASGFAHRREGYDPPPGPLCVVEVSGALPGFLWRFEPPREAAVQQSCLDYAWLQQAPDRQLLGSWGPSPLELRYRLYRLPHRALRREVVPPGYCRLHRFNWEPPPDGR